MQINHDKLPNNNIRDIIPSDVHKTRELKIAYWRRLIDEWLASGLNKQEFSKRKGISHNSLSYWRNIFLKELKIKKSRHTLDSTRKPSAAFSQLVVTLPPQPKEVYSLQSSSIEIVTPSDYKIRLPISVSADILKSVFSALEGSHAQAIK